MELLPQLQQLGRRMLGAARLDPNLYEEIEADTTAMPQAITVVVLSSLANGIALFSKAGYTGIIFTVGVGIMGWVIWAYITYWIGTRLLPEENTRSDHDEMLRVLGFATTPGILRVLAVIPGLFDVVTVLASLWILVATIIAVRQSLDYEHTWRAILVCVIGWIMYLVLTLVIMGMFGGAGTAG